MPVSVSLADLNAAVAERSASRLRAVIVGGGDVKLTGIAALSSATSSDLTFLANPLYRKEASATHAGAIVLNTADSEELKSHATRLPAMVVCDQPYAWFAYAAQILRPNAAVLPGIASGAYVADTALIDASARVDVGAIVGEGAMIGARAWIGAGATVGANGVIGDDVRLHPRAVVLDACRIGERSIVHSGAVIGGDGFGFAPLDGRWIKIPQTGAVVIGRDVEIGANTTIDRGTMGDTVIEDGVKLDNQIQIAHNCVIGAHTAIAGCVGIAGSTKVGRGCRLGGAAMIGGHLTIADGVDIGPATVVSSPISEAGNYTAFFPLMKRRDWERAAAVLRNLPELRARLRALEAEHEPNPGKVK